ncbi:aldo/keto reductase [Puniceicoccus vermicola]|uniref:Aldo/keto reductase n=1 Tax=Puniceicoccus vermicola TaxID=388746 RepID=A0A7X1AZK8_9BACT|nr:aldo/keto reductase [Puniceicoccus vermicola]MBC2602888.1 aldo/keto reductase [Puniceicoccus vermicola]
MERRKFLQSILAGTGLIALRPRSLFASEAYQNLITRLIPSSGGKLPVIGMGTWITFNVGPIPSLIQTRIEILKEFFAHGGAMIDSSPMYGSAEKVVGQCLENLGTPKNLFSATKVWTSSTDDGLKQVRDSMRLWGEPRLDLEQVHNLVNWQGHLKTLRRLKDEGTIRYVGITTSHGRRHNEIETIMKNEPLDFIQLTYNIQRREAEERLLPLAQERGIAVIANRPFGGGALINQVQRQGNLPPWAKEVGVRNWAEFLLKFIVSHPAITCAIPATSKVSHMRENMGACYGPLPDPSQRERMARYVADL